MALGYRLLSSIEYLLRYHPLYYQR